MKLNLKYINIILLIIIILLVVCMMIKKEHYKSNCNKNNRPSHNLSKNNNHNNNNNRLFAYTNNHGRNVYTNTSIERFSYNYFKQLSSLCGTIHSIDCESPDINKSDDYYNKKFIDIMSANSVEIKKHMSNIKNNATKADKTIEEYETTPEGEKDFLNLGCFLASKSECCKDKTNTYDECVSKAENELQQL